jgi:hypothetical protein
MKSTKLMLAVIATFLSTWCVMGTIGWLLSDLSFRDCLTHGATLMLLMIIGWIPAVIVGNDVNDHLSTNDHGRF